MRTLQTLASLALAVGVACGAFGAHGLKSIIPASDLLIWEKGVLYQLIHALGALILLVADTNGPSQKTRIRIARLLLISCLIFSGSLYLLVLTNQRWLGAITPIGGVGFIVSWIWLGWSFCRERETNTNVPTSP
jgi:uncharacterized membrane protein YgdD (TMEM256/DUF423 family)